MAKKKTRSTRRTATPASPKGGVDKQGSADKSAAKSPEAKKAGKRVKKAASKKAAGKKAAAKGQAKASKRAGRRRADWKHTTYAAIETWRKANHMAKYRMAELLGISNGTYHNWASGRAVPSLSTQRKIKAVISAPATSAARPASAASASPRAAGSAGAPRASETLRAATELVNTYLQTHPGKLSPDRFTSLVREVLGAVS
ncbi:MAG: helix-turn-helix transcriptional regulator [Planctomycetes bacterium]|nr:helix-turn-helix transcriptional regulator [Planctomycetota bacterium]